MTSLKTNIIKLQGNRTNDVSSQSERTDKERVKLVPYVPTWAWHARYAYIKIPVPNVNEYRLEVDILKEWRCTQDLPNTPEFQSSRTILRLIKECSYIRILEMCIEHTSTGRTYVCFRVELIKHSEALDFIKSAVEAAGKEVQIVKN